MTLNLDKESYYFVFLFIRENIEVTTLVLYAEKEACIYVMCFKEKVSIK